MLINKEKKATYLFSLVLFIFLLTGCNDSNENTIINNYYLSLSGESENWKVNSYDIVIKSETFKAGHGTLSMKNKTEYSTDFFSMEVHAVIDNEDRIIQTKSVTGSESDITQTTMGATEGGTYFDESGEPITLENISEIYMMIEWQEVNKRMEETISLYSQENFSK